MQKNFRMESVVIAIAMVLAGALLYLGLSKMAAHERVVGVRGLAEREVAADYVIWPVTYKTTGNDLTLIYTDVERALKGIKTFLTKNGIQPEEISESELRIIDLQAERYQSGNHRERYNVTAVITVATQQVDLVRQLLTRLGELLKEGIAISAGDYESRIQYEFTALNDIKPQMIEEATRNAREAAQKFASDSHSELGKIKTATQGLFTISDRDQHTPHIKKVRVVTSVNYYLEE